MEINTFNKFMVGCTGDKIVILNSKAVCQPISESEALLLAAYLVALCHGIEDPKAHFEEVYKAVVNT